MKLRSIPIFLGLLGLLAAIVIGAMTGRFMTWHLALAGLSILSIIGGLFWLQDIKWRATLSSIVYTVFFIFCAALVYMISANRYKHWDLTKDRVHSLDRQTLSVLGQLPADDRFIVQLFMPFAEHPQFERFLETYRQKAPQLSFQLIDPARDIEITSQFATAPKKGDLVVVRQDGEGNTIRRVNDSLSEAKYSQRENVVTNAIAKTLLDQRVVYYVMGHGERPLEPAEESLSRIADLIAATSSPVKPLLLRQGAIPDDAAALIMAGPSVDLFDPELENLQQYLSAGGKLLLMLDPKAQKRMTNIEELLASLGLVSPNGLIVDPLMTSQTGSSFTPQVEFNRHPITDNTQRTPILMGQARPFAPAAEVPPGTTLEALLVSGESTWFEPFDDLRSVRRPVPPEDSRDMGRQLAAVTVQLPTKGAKFGNEMRVVAVGDTDAFVDHNIDQSGGSAGFILASLGWLREERSLVYVPAKILTTTPVILTNTAFWTLMGLFVLISAMLVFGGTAWTMARRRAR